MISSFNPHISQPYLFNMTTFNIQVSHNQQLFFFNFYLLSQNIQGLSFKSAEKLLYKENNLFSMCDLKTSTCIV